MKSLFSWWKEIQLINDTFEERATVGTTDALITVKCNNDLLTQMHMSITVVVMTTNSLFT